jgi:hypothetical protein
LRDAILDEAIPKVLSALDSIRDVTLNKIKASHLILRSSDGG